MHELFVRPRARSDLKEIWGCTGQQWGVVQANQYLVDLNREIQKLLKFPELGTPCDHFRAGYRRLQVERHLVFYRQSGQRLEIVRVLHDAMDVKNHP